MMNRLFGGLLGIALVGLGSVAQADVILQDSGTGYAQIEFAEPMGQSFTAEDPFVQFAFNFDAINEQQANDPLEFLFYEGSGFGGSLLYQEVFSLPASHTGYFDIDISSVPLSVGDVYTAGLRIPGSSGRWGAGTTQSLVDPYPGGNRFLYGSSVTGDMRFRVTPTAGVPEPSMLGIFGLALIGLGLVTWRREAARSGSARPAGRAATAGRS